MCKSLYFSRHQHCLILSRQFQSRHHPLLSWAFALSSRTSLFLSLLFWKGDSNRTSLTNCDSASCHSLSCWSCLMTFPVSKWDVEIKNSVCFWNKVGEQTRGTEDWRENVFLLNSSKFLFLMVILISATIFEALSGVEVSTTSPLPNFLYKQLGSSACWVLLVRLVRIRVNSTKYPHPTFASLSLSRPDVGTV